MKYLSIDIETSGLSHEKHQILSIGIIVEDTSKKLPFEKIPKFHCGIIRDEIVGSLFAINMNSNLIRTIDNWAIGDEFDKKRIENEAKMIFCKEEDVVEKIFNFLFTEGVLEQSLYFPSNNWNTTTGNEEIKIPPIRLVNKKSKLTVAGKNFGTFDKLFIERLPRWSQVFSINQRLIDPTLLFTNWITDEALPNLSECKKRAGINEYVSHDAIEDAWDVISLLRTEY